MTCWKELGKGHLVQETQEFGDTFIEPLELQLPSCLIFAYTGWQECKANNNNWRVTNSHPVPDLQVSEQTNALHQLSFLPCGQLSKPSSL